jgi:hypothetical protein
MNSLGIRFPAAAATAVANAEECRDLSIDGRLDRLLALNRTVDAILATRIDRSRVIEERDRRKDEELATLVSVQKRGHV